MDQIVPAPIRFPGHFFPQLLPTPNELRPGGPAPWAHLEPSARRGITLSRVLDALARVGQDLRSSAPPRELAELAAMSGSSAPATPRQSAVLVGLFEESGETHVLLTRRAFHMRAHRGEIAFPGGRIEPREDNIYTALRETEEEVGIPRETVTPVGWLHPLATFSSAAGIWPIVATFDGRPATEVDPREVDRAFAVSLADLLAEGNFLEERWRRGARRPGSDAEGFFPIYFYRVPGDLIWGATARVLTELLCLVTATPWPDADRVWG